MVAGWTNLMAAVKVVKTAYSATGPDSAPKVSVRCHVTGLNLAPRDSPLVIIQRWNAETIHFQLDKSYH
jgi:hypothetical protein